MSNRASGADELLAKLRQVPTSSAKVILRELGVTRVLARGLRCIVPPAGGILAGRARTVRFLPLREDVKRGPNGPVNRALVDRLEPGEVVVMDTSASTEGSVLGDMVSMRAKVRGGVGVFADGVVRDVVGLTAVGLPVFARGIHPDPNTVSLLPWEVDVPIQCGGILVRPGDWMLADADSVIVVPAALAEEVAARGLAMNQEDVFCQALLAAGFPLDEAYPIPPQRQGDFERFKKDGYVPTWEEAQGRTK